MKLSKNSWHYKAAKFVANGYDLRWMNFCEYSRNVLLGSILILCLASLVALVAILNLAGIYAMFTGQWGFDKGDMQLSSFFNLGTGITAFMFGVLYYWNEKSIGHKIRMFLIRREQSRPQKIKTDGFIKTWYRSHKQKFCPNLEFIEDER